MKYILHNYALMEFGNRKDAEGNPHQEDCIYPAADKLSDTDRLFILCDGMGGHDAGEVASATVCESLGRSLSQSGKAFDDKSLHDAIANAYDALDAADNGAEKKMGTTMTLLKLHDGGATIAHIGDSRVYHIRPGKDGAHTRIVSVTEDHSLINDLIKIGELTREEARHSRQKNIITRAMQPKQAERCEADIAHIADIRQGDYFFLCSDGMLEQEEMENGEALRNIFSDAGGDAQNKVRILRRATENNNDNHSAIIVHISGIEDDKTPEDSTVKKATTGKKREQCHSKLIKAAAIIILIIILSAIAVIIVRFLGWNNILSNIKPL